MATRKKPPAEPWGEYRLGRALALSLNAFGRRRGHVDAARAGVRLGVSAGTVRRWVRVRVPAARRAQLEALILPSGETLAQEARELTYALAALEDIYGRGLPVAASWVEQGWTEPHVLAVVRYERLGVCVARIARASGDQKTRARMRAGGTELELEVFPNRFAAQVAKGQLLESVGAWRVQLADGLIARGRTEAWMEEAPRRALGWFVDNAPVKGRAGRRARPAKGRSRGSR